MSKKLNKSDLRDFLVVSKGITPQEAQSIIETLLNAIKTNLRRGVSVGLEGVCTLTPKKVKAHTKKGFGVIYDVGEGMKLICNESKTLFEKTKSTKVAVQNDVIDSFAESLKNFDTDLDD